MSFSGSDVHDTVKEFYTNTTHFDELQVCNVKEAETPTSVYKSLLGNIHEDTIKKFLGCGVPDASALDGLRVLDLGCGYGRDVYIYSQMVGENGHVTGIDITPRSIEDAKTKIEYHTKKFGYHKPNVEFLVGNAENLSAIKDSSIDVVMSEGVTCLVPDKSAMMKEICRVLKPGGEFCNLDVYTSVEQFDELKADGVMWAEGYGGCFSWKSFVDQCTDLGFTTPIFRSVCIQKPKEDGVRKRLQNREDLYQKFAKIIFGNISCRTFKVNTVGSQPATVTYQGGIPFFDMEYTMDITTVFKKGQAVPVGANLAAILTQSRLAKFFTIAPLPVNVKPKMSYVDPFEWSSEQRQH